MLFWLFSDRISRDPGYVVNHVAKRPGFVGPFEIFCSVRMNELEIVTDILYHAQDQPDLEAMSGVWETTEPFERFK